MLMQTGWIQAIRRVTRRLAWDSTRLPLSLSFPIKNKQNLQVIKSRRQYDLFLENYPAFKGLIWFSLISIRHLSLHVNRRLHYSIQADADRLPLDPVIKDKITELVNVHGLRKTGDVRKELEYFRETMGIPSTGTRFCPANYTIRNYIYRALHMPG